MLIRHLKDCPEFTAGDNCRLRELLNAKTDDRAFNLVFLCIVDPAWCAEDEEILAEGLHRERHPRAANGLPAPSRPHWRRLTI